MNTLFLAFSVTKGITSILIYKLVEDGFIDYDKTVSHYWSKFGQNGKDKITVRQLLSHQSGLHHMPWSQCDIKSEDMASVNLNPEHLTKEFMLTYLEQAKPLYETGTKTGYCAITFSWLILGLLENAMGKSFQQLLLEYIIQPFGVFGDVFVGLPKDHQNIDRLARIDIKIPDRGPEMYLVAPAKMWDHFDKYPGWHLCLPGVNGYFTARALAKIYGTLANTSSEIIRNLYHCETEDIVLEHPLEKICF